MSHLLTWKGGIHELSCSQPPGGHQDVSASLLGSCQAVHLHRRSMFWSLGVLFFSKRNMVSTPHFTSCLYFIYFFTLFSVFFSFVTRLISIPRFHCCHLVVLYSSCLDLDMLPPSLCSDLHCSSSHPSFLSFFSSCHPFISLLCCYLSYFLLSGHLWTFYKSINTEMNSLD